jgi:alpha-galactosidase
MEMHVMSATRGTPVHPTASELAKARGIIQQITRAETVPVCVTVGTVKQGWGELQFGHPIHYTVDRTAKLILHGVEYTRMLGTHADSELLVSANRPIRRFTAVCGIDDNLVTARRADTRIVFSVEVDGKVLWQSGEMAREHAPANVDVDLGDVRRFTLKARELKGDPDCAHASWANPKLVFDDQTFDLGSPTLTCTGPDLSLPIAFTYDGVSSETFLDSWPMRKDTTQLSNTQTLHRITRTDPKTKLECILEVTEFADSPAVEWVCRFHNAGTANTPIIENILAMNASGAVQNPTLHWSRGSDLKLDDFGYYSDPIATGTTIHKTVLGGRSSDACLPFFNLSFGDPTCSGAILAIGWTGHWYADFENIGNAIDIRAGMGGEHLTLHPGETIRTPRILWMPWEGSEPLRGNNLLRRFILAHHTYRPDGKTVPAPIAMSHWGGMKAPHQLDRVQLMVSEKLDYEYYWIDAGWYGPADSYSPDEFVGDWYMHVGNWDINPVAYPSGLRPVADAIHAAGKKFLLWFEPERAVYGTPWTQQYPEFFIGNRVQNGTMLYNLGDPTARRWLIDNMSRMITEFGVDCYRQDFNMDPLPFWDKNDAPDRKGITQIRHIEGLYEFWDALLKKHPGLIIDNCASGGRRIDLETIGRSIPLWRSDVQCWPDFDPIASQIETYGLAHWVPCSTCGTQMRRGDTYNFRSAMCTGVVFHLFGYEHNPIDPKYPYDWHRKMLADQRRAIPYYLGDYYPLTTCTTQQSDWMAYQMNRADLGEGMVIAYRREKSPFISASFMLSGLNDQTLYEFEDADTGDTWTARGYALRTTGALITAAQPRSSRLLFYKAID